MWIIFFRPEQLSVYLIELTSVVKSPCLHLVGVLMVELSNSVSYLFICIPCLCWGEMKFIHLSPCSLMNCASKEMYYPGGHLGWWTASVVVPGPIGGLVMIKIIV